MAVEKVLTWEQVAQAIFSAQGISQGLWHIGVGLRFAGVTGDWKEPDGTDAGGFPTAFVAVTGVGLTPVSEPGAMVFDARTGKLTTIAETPSAGAKEAKKKKTATRQGLVRPVG